MKNILNFYHYHKWANERVFGHLEGLPEGVAQQEVESVFPTILDVLAHMYSVDTMWFSVIRGDNFAKTLDIVKQLRRDSQEKSLAELRECFDGIQARCLSYFEVQDDLETLITVDHPEFGELEASLSELISHVVNHGTYHRGNITAMLRQLGYSGVSTDYVIYLFESGKKR